MSPKPTADPTLSPRLVVRDAAKALAWYADAFGAVELERYTLPDGGIAHAALAVDDGVFALTEAEPKWNSRDPHDLGGSPVALSLKVADPDAFVTRAVERGATVVFPLADQPYGHRGGRIADPFGHLWIVWKVIEALTPDQIQARMAAYGD